MNTEQIEETFNKAISIAFIMGLNDEPDMIAFIFQNPMEGKDVYALIHDEIPKEESRATFDPISDERMNITIENKQYNYVIRIKNIEYQKPNYDGFKYSFDGKYCLLVNMFVSSQPKELALSGESTLTPVLLGDLNFL